MGWLLFLDQQGLLLIHGALGRGPTGVVFDAISHLGDWAAVWLAMCAVVLWLGRGDEDSHRTVVLAVVALLAAEALAAGLKIVVGRPRPADLFSDIVPLQIVGGFSFPSAHSARSFAAAGVLAAYLTRSGWILWVVAALIALSRVVVGVHYPLDVLAGALMGAAVAWALLQAGARWRATERQPTDPDATMPGSGREADQ